MLQIKKLIPLFFFGAIFGFVVWQIKPPQSLPSISLTQLILFFIPLLLFLTFCLNLFFKFLLRSFAVALGLILFLVLKSLNILNLATVSVIFLVIVILVRIFKKPGKTFYQVKIPKLSKLSKQRSFFDKHKIKH